MTFLNEVSYEIQLITFLLFDIQSKVIMQTEQINQNKQIVNNEQITQQTIELTVPSQLPIRPVKIFSCIQLANMEVDQVTASMYEQILEGIQKMNRKKLIQLNQDEKGSPKKKKKSPQIIVNIDQHKKKVRKFMRLHKRSVQNMQKQSIEMYQASRKQKEQQQKRRDQERNKTLEARRSKIQDRMKNKQQMLQELRRQMAQSNKKLSTIKTSTFLYQQKEQIFKRQFILPKIQEQKRILQKKKEEMRRPIDISALLEHEKLYEEKRTSDRINRSLTSRVLQSQNYYQPPKFISKAFIISEAEQNLKKEEQKLKEQQVQINEFRKKEFIKLIGQRQKYEFEKIKQRSLQKSRSGNNLIISQKKEPVKQKLKPEQIKQKGNQYMKELIQLNKSRRRKTGQPKMSLQISNKNSRNKTFVPRTQEQINEIRQQQVQKFEKLRQRKIDDIIGNKRIGKQFKLQRLHHQAQKLDNLVAFQQKMAKTQNSEYTMLVLSSIQTKLAILQVSSPKRNIDE